MNRFTLVLLGLLFVVPAYGGYSFRYSHSYKSSSSSKKSRVKGQVRSQDSRTDGSGSCPLECGGRLRSGQWGRGEGDLSCHICHCIKHGYKLCFPLPQGACRTKTCTVKDVCSGVQCPVGSDCVPKSGKAVCKYNCSSTEPFSVWKAHWCCLTERKCTADQLCALENKRCIKGSYCTLDAAGSPVCAFDCKTDEQWCPEKQEYCCDAENMCTDEQICARANLQCGAGQYCQVNASREPECVYNCFTKEVWTAEKEEYCCDTEDICTDEQLCARTDLQCGAGQHCQVNASREPECVYNCFTREVWTAEKEEYCCDTEDICTDEQLCTRTDMQCGAGQHCQVSASREPECVYNCFTREVWTPEKQEYCCNALDICTEQQRCKRAGVVCGVGEICKVNLTSPQCMYDCTTDEEFTAEKAEHCCKEEGVCTEAQLCAAAALGCISPAVCKLDAAGVPECAYNCSQLPSTFSDPQRNYCCRAQNVGCDNGCNEYSPQQLQCTELPQGLCSYDRTSCSCGVFLEQQCEDQCKEDSCRPGYNCVPVTCNQCGYKCVPDDACTTDLECGADEMCREGVLSSERCDLIRRCYARSQEGERCHGGRTACTEAICAPGLQCTSTSHSVAGTCITPESGKVCDAYTPAVTCPEGQCYNAMSCQCGEFVQKLCSDTCNQGTCRPGYKCSMASCGECRAVCSPP